MNNDSTTTSWEGDTYGWMAAVIAMMAMGTFGVPIKQQQQQQQQSRSQATTATVVVHPWVWQSYKTVVVFFSSLVVTIVLPVTQQQQQLPRWTPWGIVSGTLWVCGGTAGVYAIAHAGLATAVGTWASVSVLVNFVWGFLIFQEPIHNIGSLLACLFGLSVGLLGMSYYANTTASPLPSSSVNDDSIASLLATVPSSLDTFNTVDDLDEKKEDSFGKSQQQLRIRTAVPQSNNDDDATGTLSKSPPSGGGGWRTNTHTNSLPDDETTELANQEETTESTIRMTEKDKTTYSITTTTSNRSRGILAAVVNGILSGSSLFPVRYAKTQGLGGIHYFWSHASGALLGNILGWVLWWTWLSGSQASSVTSSDSSNKHNSNSNNRWKLAWQALPSWHVQHMAVAGTLCGILLAVGMLGSMVAVTHLGQGVGNSVIQAKIIVSGLWGICYFGEIKGTKRIGKWIASAVVAVLSILWLSAQRRWALMEEQNNITLDGG